jgi:hypothetical protein
MTGLGSVWAARRPGQWGPKPCGQPLLFEIGLYLVFESEVAQLRARSGRVPARQRPTAQSGGVCGSRCSLLEGAAGTRLHAIRVLADAGTVEDQHC